jgi:hypothetical protein
MSWAHCTWPWRGEMPSPARGPLRLPYHWGCQHYRAREGPHPPREVITAQMSHAANSTREPPYLWRNDHEGNLQEQIHHRGRCGCRLLPGPLDHLRQGGERTGDPWPLPTPHCQPHPAWLGRIRRRAATSGGRRAQRPARAGRRMSSTGMGPHRPECRECEEGVRDPSLPSSSTTWVVPGWADSSGGRA